MSVALLRVNHQVSAEAAPVLYGQKLTFDNSTSLLEFLMRISAGMRALLKDLRVMHWTRQPLSINRGVFHLLKDAMNLHSFRIEDKIVGKALRGSVGLADQIYGAAWAFIEAYGLAHGSKTAALDVIELCDENFKDSVLMSWEPITYNADGSVDENVGLNKAIYESLLSRIIDPLSIRRDLDADMGYEESP